MQSLGKTELGSGEVTLWSLLGALAEHKEKPLKFSYDGRAIQPGYHVTEVKTGRFDALDCGANAEAWTETFIQLWDVDEAPHRHMAAGKFIAIVNKVASRVPLNSNAKVTFEVSDGVDAIRLFAARDIVVEGDAIAVTLGRQPASCKPRDRWLLDGGAEEQAKASCCTPQASQAKSACCV